MDTPTIIKMQRNLILNKYGIDIYVERTELDDYKYTISNNQFEVNIYRDIEDEVNTLKQIMLYLDSPTHQISFAEAKAYDDCCQRARQYLSACLPYNNTAMYLNEINNKLQSAKKVELSRDLHNLELKDIKSFFCSDIIGLENSRERISNLYANLHWLHSVTEDKSNCIEETPEKE